MLAGAAGALSHAGSAAAEGCRLALVLALDISSSVDAEEDRLQREGLASALLAPEVAQAFLAGDPVALFAFEWSGSRVQAALLPGWVTVRSEAELRGAAAAIRAVIAAYSSAPSGWGLSVHATAAYSL